MPFSDAKQYICIDLKYLIYDEIMMSLLWSVNKICSLASLACNYVKLENRDLGKGRTPPPNVILLCTFFKMFSSYMCLHTSLLLISLPSISHLIILTMIGNWSLSSCLSCIDWRPNLNFSFTLSLSIMMMLFPRLLSWRYISKPDGSSLKMDRFPDDVRIAIR